MRKNILSIILLGVIFILMDMILAYFDSGEIDIEEFLRVSKVVISGSVVYILIWKLYQTLTK